MSNYDTYNSLNMSMSFLSLESEEVAFKYKNVLQIEKEDDFNKIYSIPNKFLLSSKVNEDKFKMILLSLY